jgi:hypothetical protein
MISSILINVYYKEVIVKNPLFGESMIGLNRLA